MKNYKYILPLIILTLACSPKSIYATDLTGEELQAIGAILQDSGEINSSQSTPHITVSATQEDPVVHAQQPPAVKKKEVVKEPTARDIFLRLGSQQQQNQEKPEVSSSRKNARRSSRDIDNRIRQLFNPDTRRK